MPKVFEANHKIEIVEYGIQELPEISISKLVRGMYEGACKLIGR